MKRTSRPHLIEFETGIDRFLKDLFHGPRPKIEKSFCVSGRITPQLKRRITSGINYILEGCDGFKIGKTGDS